MRYKYFVPQDFQNFVSQCFKIIKSGEPGVILFSPKMDRVRRIEQLIQDYSQEIQLVKFDLSPGETSEIEEIEYNLKDLIGHKTKKEIAILISNAELIIQEKNYGTLDELFKLQSTNPHYRFLLFFELDITHPEISKWLTGTQIFTNIVYYPLYKRVDTLSFMNYSLDDWKFIIKDTIKEKIYENCGGHFWLVRQVIRSLRDNPLMTLDQIFKSEQIRFRLERIFYTFMESERKVLHKIIKGQTIEEGIEKHSYEYLTEMGFIQNDAITVPLLAQYIQENMPKISIEINEKQLLLNNVNVDSNFSKKEKRALKILIENKGRIVSRDQLGKALWPINTEEDYSDWAVDRIISRARTKLSKLGLPKTIIKTLRNQGYILVN